MENIGVSILVLAYNHENYISDAIEGFLKQKTSFPIEIIINEDKSTDKTRDIIKKYEEKYPEIIKPIYHTENQYSKGININAEFMLPKATGKYVALCDGDDYWTDENKLQKQYDALEENPDCYMCLHNVKDLRLGEENKKFYIPINQLETGKLESKEFLSFLCKDGNFFNEVCYFFNAEKYREYQNNYPDFAKAFMKNKTDDMPMLLYFANMGNVFYINEAMAIYRRFVSGSWSAALKAKDNNAFRIFAQNSKEAYEEYNRFTNGKYQNEIEHKLLYFSFKVLECDKNYKEMTSQKYKSIFETQGKKYQKRIKLLAKSKFLFTPIFAIYDKLRGNK